MKQIFILTLVFVVAIVCIIASIPRSFSFVNAPRASAAAPWLTLRDDGPMPDLGGAVAWLNSPPLNRQSLRGKVALVDIWTYSCINSLRQFPYVRNWASKYKDAGLVVIGVHAPEFGFEAKRVNVERAVLDLKITYPVPIDSNHQIWDSFNNKYWPADYFIDAKGRIRYHHFGEGEYAESEPFIQELLKENGATVLPEILDSIAADGIEAPPSGDVQSPETYVSYRRAEHFASPERLAQDSRQTYSSPASLSLNQWGLANLMVGSKGGRSKNLIPVRKCDSLCR